MSKRRYVIPLSLTAIALASLLPACSEKESSPSQTGKAVILSSLSDGEGIVESLKDLAGNNVSLEKTASVLAITGHTFPIQKTKTTYQDGNVHVEDYTINSYVSIGQIEASNVSETPLDEITYYDSESGQAVTKHLSVDNTVKEHPENRYEFNWDTYETDVIPIAYDDVSRNPLSSLFGKDDLGSIFEAESIDGGYLLSLGKDHLQDDDLLDCLSGLYSVDSGYSYSMGSLSIEIGEDLSVERLFFQGYHTDNSYSSYQVEIEVLPTVLEAPVDFSPKPFKDRSSNPYYLNYYGKKNLEYVAEEIGTGENYNFALEVHIDGLGDEEFYGYSDTDYTIYADSSCGIILMLFPGNYAAYKKGADGKYSRYVIDEDGTASLSSSTAMAIEDILPDLKSISTDYFEADTAEERLVLDLDGTETIDSSSFDEEFLLAAFGQIELASISTYPLIDYDSLEKDFKEIRLLLESSYGEYTEKASPVICYTAYSQDLSGLYEMGSYTLYARYGSFGEVDLANAEDPQVKLAYDALMAL